MVLICYCRRLNLLKTLLIKETFFAPIKRQRASFWLNIHRTYVVGRNETRNFYDVLGVKRDATTKQIKGAYYELSKKYHPDTNKSADAPSALKKFQEISSAYETLSNKSKRSEYDRTLHRTSSASTSYDDDEEDEVYRTLKRNDQIRRTYQYRGKTENRSQAEREAYMRHAQRQYDEMRKRPFGDWSSTASSKDGPKKRTMEEELASKMNFREFGRRQDEFTDFQKEMFRRQQAKIHKEFVDNFMTILKGFFMLLVFLVIVNIILG